MNHSKGVKSKTIGELVAEIRKSSGAEKLDGHDLYGMERFFSNVRHMIVFDVLSHEAPVGDKGAKMRLFLSDTGYLRALKSQNEGHIKIRAHANVVDGEIRCETEEE